MVEVIATTVSWWSWAELAAEACVSERLRRGNACPDMSCNRKHQL